MYGPCPGLRRSPISYTSCRDARTDLGHHPLVGRADVVLTPHVAFYSESALEDLRRISASNIREFLEGRPDRVFRLVEPAV